MSSDKQVARYRGPDSRGLDSRFPSLNKNVASISSDLYTRSETRGCLNDAAHLLSLPPGTSPSLPHPSSQARELSRPPPMRFASTKGMAMHLPPRCTTPAYYRESFFPLSPYRPQTAPPPLLARGISSCRPRSRLAVTSPRPATPSDFSSSPRELHFLQRELLLFQLVARDPSFTRGASRFLEMMLFFAINSFQRRGLCEAFKSVILPRVRFFFLDAALTDFPSIARLDIPRACVPSIPRLISR